MYTSYVGLVTYQYSKRKTMERRNSKKNLFFTTPRTQDVIY